MAGCTLPWTERVYRRVVAVINSATKVSVELRQMYLDDLECGFEPLVYHNMSDREIVADIILYGEMAKDA